MKRFFILAIVIVVVLLAVFISRDSAEAPVQKETTADEHVYASWETTEFDKCVSAWLIVRFIDPDARFVLYPHGTEISEGVVFDVPGSPWSRQHRKCTSDCIIESLGMEDEAVRRIVEIAHNVELNFWQLESFPEASQCFQDVKEICDSTTDKIQCFEKTRTYFDNLYNKLKQERGSGVR